MFNVKRYILDKESFALTPPHCGPKGPVYPFPHMGRPVPGFHNSQSEKGVEC